MSKTSKIVPLDDPVYGKAMEVDNMEGALHLPVATTQVPSKHATRRESIHQGLKVLDNLQRAQTMRVTGILALENSYSSKNSVSDDSASSTDDTYDKIAAEEVNARVQARHRRMRATIIASAKNEAPDSLDSEEEKEVEGVLRDLDIDSLSISELSSRRAVMEHKASTRDGEHTESSSEGEEEEKEEEESEEQSEYETESEEEEESEEEYEEASSEKSDENEGESEI
eukprot:gene20509-23297_t